MYGFMRPEARPLDNADRLTRSQKKAKARIVGALRTAVDALPDLRDSKPRDKDRDLDETRASRLFFLSSGEPGTGKTTVYLSTKKELQGHEADNDLKNRLIWLEPLNLETIGEKTPNYLAAVLARIDRALAEIVDGRSDSWSPRQGLLERSSFSDALMKFQRLRTDIGLAWTGNLPQRSERLDPDVGAEEILRAENARLRINERLHEVLEDLTGEIFHHKYRNPLLVLPIDDLYLHPDSSLELLRLLRMISVPRLFILILGDDQAVEEFFYQQTLGDLIRLAGDKSFTIERQRRVLMARARHLTFQNLRKLLPPAQQYRLEALFWDEAMTLSPEGFVFHPDPSGESSKDRKPDQLQYGLWHLLNLLPLDLDLGSKSNSKGVVSLPETLFDFLSLPGNSKLGKRPQRQDLERNPAKVEDDAYTALQVFEAPCRVVLDLWFDVRVSLGEHPKLKKYDPELSWKEVWDKDEDGQPLPEAKAKRLATKVSIALAVDQATRALNEQDYLTHGDRETFEDALQGTQYTKLRLHTDSLEAQPEHDANSLKIAGTPVGGADCYLEFRWHRGWQLRPRRKQSQNMRNHDCGTSEQEPDTPAKGDMSGDEYTPGRWSQLPPRPKAWFVLLHDLLVLSRREGLFGDPLTPGHGDNETDEGLLCSPEHEWAVVCWRKPSLGYRPSTKNTVTVCWPIPRWPSFWQYDRFLCAWNQVLERARDAMQEQETEPLEKLAFHWINFCASVFLNERFEPEVFTESEESKKYFDQTKWEVLIGKLVRLLDVSKKQPRYAPPPASADAKRWLAHLALMMAPECGLSDSVVQHFLDKETSLRDFWLKDVAEEIRLARARTLARFHDADLVSTIKRWRDRPFTKNFKPLIPTRDEIEQFSKRKSDGEMESSTERPKAKARKK